AQRADRHRVDIPEIVALSKKARLVVVEHCVGKSRSSKDRSRHLPALHKVIRAVAAECGLHWHLPNVTRVERVPDIIVSWAVRPSEIVRILSIRRATIGERHPRQTTVGDFIEGMAI